MVNTKIVTIRLHRGYSYSSNNSERATLAVELVDTLDSDKIKEAYEKINTKSYSPKAKDKLYFYPECTVPRVKVRELWKPKKVSVTIKEDYGTHKFISTEINKYVDQSSNFYKVKRYKVQKWLEYHAPIFEKYGLDDMSWNNFDQETKDLITGAEYVYINWVFDNVMLGSGSQHLVGNTAVSGNVSFPVYAYTHTVQSTDDYESENYNTATAKEERVIEVFNDILAGNDSEYYTDEAVNRALQDDSTIINEPMYEQLYNLLNSKDEDNHIMAMQVMANSNVEKSAKWIYKLFKNFHNTMIYSNEYNTVNFRSLRDTCNIQRYTSFNDDNYINFLHRFNQLDIDVIHEIRQKALQIANDHIESEFHSLINDKILDIKIPFIGVVLKGVNDGSQDITIIDNQEEEANALAALNPAQYSPDYIQESTVLDVTQSESDGNISNDVDVHVVSEDSNNEVSSINEESQLIDEEDNELELQDRPEEGNSMEDEVDDYEQGDIVEMEKQVEQVEMQTSEVIMEAHQGLVEDNMKEAEEKREESVFEPIAQALKPEVNDNWWETSEVSSESDSTDPFA
jgi:hypothetical protein